MQLRFYSLDVGLGTNLGEPLYISSRRRSDSM
jgi:hypothetical protein